MKIVKNFVLNQNDSKPIILDYYYSELSNKMPLIIFCHGYKGFKDWGAWDLVAEEFANNNFFFVKFNFGKNPKKLVGTPTMVFSLKWDFIIVNIYFWNCCIH